MMSISHFFKPVGYGYWTVVSFLIPFKFIYHARTSIPRKNYPSINIVYNGIDPNIKLVTQRFTYLDIPTKYQNLIHDMTLTLTTRSLVPLLMLVIDTHTFTYIPDQYWS